MNRNKQQNKQSITPMQKQALWVCGLCAVAVLLTAGITLTKLAQGKYQPPASSEPAQPEQPMLPGEEDLSGHYQIDNTSAALLAETPDAGEEYLAQTLLIPTRCVSIIMVWYLCSSFALKRGSACTRHCRKGSSALKTTITGIPSRRLWL